MILSVVILIIGFVLLVKGADFFVEGASDIARKLGIPSIVIGLTIVALGTSLPELAGSRDTCLLQAGGEEGVYLAGLDLDMLRAYRGREVHGNAYRRPKKYALLTDTRIDEPFIRANRRE